MPGCIRRFQSTSPEARTAVQEFRDGVWQSDIALVLFFCSSSFDLGLIADEMGRQFPGTPVFGCTTAGEIGPSGYLEKSLTGVSFPGDTFAAAGRLVPDLKHFQVTLARATVQDQLSELDSKTARSPELVNRFALSLIDGLSNREELVTRAFQLVLDDVCLVGGSAGDDLAFRSTLIYADGRFHSDAAAVILLATSRPVRSLKIQNFVAKNERFVVTKADPATRLVVEVNGLPAAEEYARAVGADPDHLSAERLADAPAVIALAGASYVRAVRTVNRDGSLTFFSAIDEGMIFRVSDMTDLLSNMSNSLEEVCGADGPPSLLIAFDCILRRLSASNRQLTGAVSTLLKANNAVGFSGYGEQYNGMHVNHTLTGVALWESREGDAYG